MTTMEASDWSKFSDGRFDIFEQWGRGGAAPPPVVVPPRASLVWKHEAVELKEN